MSITITKICHWCGTEMQTSKCSKRLCSQRCHQAFHRWRNKHYPGEGPAFGFSLIKEALLKNDHPNKAHQIHKSIQAQQSEETI